MTTATANPVHLYMASLSDGSQGMVRCLDVIARILGHDGDAETFPWETVTYRDSMKVRVTLADRYKPSTVNKMLSTLRGVLKQTWRLGLLDADRYRRAIDVPNLRSSNLLSGRALAGDEVAKLFRACTVNPTPKGARDAALFAVFYGCGLRRGELARLDVEDFDSEECSIIVFGKRRKQRTVYLTDQACRYVQEWLAHRGDEPGPMFCPVSQTGEVRLTRLRGESIAYILRRRQEEAGTEPFSPHDLRRTAVTHMLDAGVDVFTVQKLAGHADASMTARYDRRDEGTMRRAVQVLSIPS